MNFPRLFPAAAAVDGSAFHDLERSLAMHEGGITALYGAIMIAGLIVDFGLLLYWRTHPIRWRERVSRLYWRPWRPRDGLLVVGALIALHLVLLALLPSLTAWFLDRGWRESSALIVSQSLTFHWAGLAIVAALTRAGGIPWRSAFGWSAQSSLKNAVRGFLLLLATMPILMFYTAVYHFLLDALDMQPTLQDVTSAIAGENSTPMRVYFALLAVAIAPLFEEILFRGIGLPLLAQRYGVGFAVVAISIIFALVHGHVPSLVPLFLLSVALSLAYIYTESIVAPVVMHSLFNTVTVTILMSVG